MAPYRDKRQWQLLRLLSLFVYQRHHLRRECPLCRFCDALRSEEGRQISRIEYPYEAEYAFA